MKLSDAEAIFNQALEMDSVAKRAEYIRSACGQDTELRIKVERLLKAHDDAGHFLQSRTVCTAPRSEGPGTQIGKFKILEQIGEGGFGVVYMAEQKEPVRRRVALKIIKLGMDTKQVVARFEAERQALALMDHPNIAKILDGGVTGTFETEVSDSKSHLPDDPPQSQIANRESQMSPGRPYFVMELVKGRPITKFCDEEKLSTSQRLELFIAVCHAVQHAHQKGLVHRDLKPSNLIVSFIDGQPVPKIIDFGIAKAMQHDLTDKTVFTRFHQFMGTPAYMSPEQAGTDSADIDTRSDIYSLGAVLYELLTGRTPMDSRQIASADYDEIRRQIREVEPPRPSNRIGTLADEERTTVARCRSIEPGKLRRLVRGDLDWIVLKAMEKDRNRRYETANELAKDIRCYLDNEPVTAVKPSPIYRFQKFARRHKVALATAASFALLLTVSAGVSTAQAIKNKSLFTAAEEAKLTALSAKERETELRRIAETERVKAEIERDRSKRILYGAGMNLADRACDEGNVSRALEILDLYHPQAGQPDLRNYEWFYLDRLCHRELLTLKGHTNVVCGVAFSPDGKRLASASGDKTVTVWDVASAQELLTLKGHTDMVFSVAFSPDGKRLASSSGYWRDQRNVPGEVKIWDVTSGRQIITLSGHSNAVLVVAFSPDGKRLASASGDRTVKVWDAASGQELLTFKGHTASVRSVAFSPDGNQLASASWDQTAKVWDATSGRELLTVKGRNGSIVSVAFSPDGTRLAGSIADPGDPKRGCEVKVWDVANGQELLTLRGHTGPIWSVAFSSDGRFLASASSDQTVRVWDAASGQQMVALRGHVGPVYSVAFSSDGKRLASASSDRTVKIWDAAPDPLPFNGHIGRVVSVAFSPDGKRLFSAGLDRTLKIWDAASGREMLTLKGHTDAVNSLALSPDGKRLASASRDGTLKLWDATTGLDLLTLKEHSGPVENVAFSPDGKRLASASDDKTIKLWDAKTGQETLTLKGHSNQVSGVAFSPDGKRLASSSGDISNDDTPGEIKVWDTTSGQEMLVLKGHTNGINRVAFSPDGKRLASASWDGTVKVWDAGSGEETSSLEGHRFGVRGLTFSPDGTRLASASDDGTVKLWDIVTGQEMLTLKGHAGGVKAVAFSPDGKRLASAGGEYDKSKPGELKVWDARPRLEASTH